MITMLTRGYIVILSFVYAFELGASEFYENMTALKVHLLDGYRTDILPRKEISPIIINISMMILYVRETDITKGTANIDIQVGIHWIDAHLKWNPLEYNNIEKVYFQQKEIWAPSIVVASSKNSEQINDLQSILTAENNSNVRMRSVKNVDIYCLYDVQYWPFDKSLCLVSIMVNYYTNEAVQVHKSQQGDVVAVNKTAVWNIKVISHSTLVSPGISVVMLCIELQRNPTFYLFSIILPIVCILVMNTFVFILPIESGERIGFSLTLMLATAVFLTVIADEIPKSSDPFPVICIFLFSAIVHGTLNTIVLILSMRIYYRKSHVKIGTFYCFVVKITNLNCISNVLRYNKRKTKEQERSREHAVTPIGQGINIETTSCESVNMDSCTQESKNGADMNKDIQDMALSWQDVGKAIDIILFVFSIAFILGGSILSFYYLKVSSNNEYFLNNLAYCYS